MKRRRDTGEFQQGRSGDGDGVGAGGGNAAFKKQQHEQQHWKRRAGGGGLGGRGGGLSLDAFVTAKSKPRINPAQIRQHREFYKNAKKVQKYKKLVKNHVGNQRQDTVPKSEEPAAGNIEEHDDEVATDKYRSESKGKAGGSSVGKKLAHLKMKTDGKQFKAYRKHQARQKGTSHMEKLREAYEKDKLEKEEQKREREKQYAEQQQAREKVLHERKESKAKLRKKTPRGQPVMKHRMEQLLETIQQGSS